MLTVSLLTLASAIVSAVSLYVIDRRYGCIRELVSLLIFPIVIYVTVAFFSTQIASLLTVRFLIYVLAIVLINLSVTLIYRKWKTVRTSTFFIFSPLVAIILGYVFAGPFEPSEFVQNGLMYLTGKFSLGALYVNQVANIVFLIASLIYLTSPSNELIVAILKKSGAIIKEKSGAINGNTSELDIGKLIGIAERWLFFVLILLGEIGSLAFILAAKTAVRYNKIKNGQDNFADYFLLGTLTSVAFALSLGLFFKYIILPLI